MFVNRNNGLKFAKGKYIAFFDSDDLLKPDAYEKLINACETNKTQRACGIIQSFNAKGATWILDFHKQFIINKQNISYKTFPSIVMNISPVNKVFLRSWFNKVGGLKFDSKIQTAEDLLAVGEILLKADGISLISDITVHYRSRSDGSSITQLEDKKSFMDSFTLLKSLTIYIKNTI